MKVLVLLPMLLLVGCASIECTTTERNNLINENSKLLAEKADIEAYDSGSKKIYKGSSLLSEKQLINEKVYDYNRRVYSLEQRASEFNKKCTK